MSSFYHGLLLVSASAIATTFLFVSFIILQSSFKKRRNEVKLKKLLDECNNTCTGVLIYDNKGKTKDI